MLKFLGNGSAFNFKRGCTSAYFEMGTELFVIDCGEDVLKKLADKKLFDDKTRVNFFITHLHGDHAGSLSSAVYYLYYKKFNMDKSKICVYFPDRDICEFLNMSGVTEEFYTHFINKWDNVFPDGTELNFEYNFIEASHAQNMKCYSITIEVPKQQLIYYSGDSSVFPIDSRSIDIYDKVYNEVSFIKASSVHMYFEDLLEKVKDFTAEQKQKIYLMHLEDEADCDRIIKEGFNIAECE